MRRFLAKNVTSLPVSQTMTGRPLAYHSLPNHAGILEISAKLGTMQAMQNWEKLALDIWVSVGRFVALI